MTELRTGLRKRFSSAHKRWIDVKTSGQHNCMEITCTWDMGSPASTALRKHARRDWKTECIVYWGPTRSGKSKHVFELAPNAYRVPNPKGSSGPSGQVYWDGYDGQDDIWIDDFYGWLPYANRNMPENHENNEYTLKNADQQCLTLMNLNLSYS